MFVRIERFALKPGAEEKGLGLLRQYVAFIRASPGCGRAYLGVPIHETAHVVVSEWQAEADLDRLEATFRSNPDASGAFFALMGIVRSPPHVARFQVAP